MATRKDSKHSTESTVRCKWCHYSPFRRTVHMLDMAERGVDQDNLRSHLLSEFPHQDEASGFFDAELRSVAFVRGYYTDWRDWQRNKVSSVVIARIQDWLNAE